MRPPTRLGIVVVIALIIFCLVAVAIIDRRFEGGLWRAEWWQWLREAWT